MLENTAVKGEKPDVRKTPKNLHLPKFLIIVSILSAVAFNCSIVAEKTPAMNGRDGGICDTNPLLIQEDDPNATALPSNDSLAALTITDSPNCSEYGTLTENLSSVKSYVLYHTKFSRCYGGFNHFRKKHRQLMYFIPCVLLCLVFCGILACVGYLIAEKVDATKKCEEDPLVTSLYCCDAVNMLVESIECNKTTYSFQPADKCSGNFQETFVLASAYDTYCYLFWGRYKKTFANYHYIKQTRHVAYDMNYLLQINGFSWNDYMWIDFSSVTKNFLAYSSILDNIRAMKRQNNHTFAEKPNKCYGWYLQVKDAPIWSTSAFCGLQQSDVVKKIFI